MNKTQNDETKERSPKDSENIGEVCAGVTFLISLFATIIAVCIAHDIGRSSISYHINRLLYKQAVLVAKEHKVSPAQLTLKTDRYTNLNQLDQCNLKFPQKELVNYCNPLGAYVEADTLNRLAGGTYAFTASLDIYKWSLSKIPGLIATLSVAKHIVDEKGLGRDTIERTEIEYCLVGSQARSIYGTSQKTLQSFLDEHLSIAIDFREDIPPVEQQIAIAKGWSGEACY